MVAQSIIFFSILAVFILWALNREKLRYWSSLLMEKGWTSTVHYERCSRIFRKLYEDVDAMSVSIKERDEKSLREDMSHIYGEVLFFSFAKILEMAKPLPGEVFYDLGSGGGKAVFIAGLVFDFSKTCGIEKLTDLYNLCVSLKEKLVTLPDYQRYLPNKASSIDFIHGDFLETDLSDANIIFINAVCFRGKLWDALLGKLVKLKSGTRVILVGNQLHVGGFELEYKNTHLMSWGLGSIYIYRKV